MCAVFARGRVAVSSPLPIARPHQKGTPLNTHLPLTSDTLDSWLTAAAQCLGLDDVFDADEALRTGVLQLAANVAHGVARPSAPLTTFLLGLHAGRSGLNAEATQAAADQLTALVERFTAERDGAAPNEVDLTGAQGSSAACCDSTAGAQGCECKCDCDRDCDCDGDGERGESARRGGAGRRGGSCCRG